jgi:hypothetical protein
MITLSWNYLEKKWQTFRNQSIFNETDEIDFDQKSIFIPSNVVVKGQKLILIKIENPLTKLAFVYLQIF